MTLRHVVPETRSRCLVRHEAISLISPSELDVRLERVHQRRIAERENAAEILLRDCGANLPGDVPITADGFV
jgi:hypothetical protein